MTSSVVLYPFFSDWRVQLIIVGVVIIIAVILALIVKFIPIEETKIIIKKILEGMKNG